MIDLAGKRAFVTGGGRGIGRATAILLARAGAKVAVGYRARKPAAEPHVTAAVRGDLGTAAGAKKAVGEALRALGGSLDILVVNHGVWPADDVPVAELSDEQWESTRRANLDAVIYVCRAAIREIPQGGTIILVSSTAGQRGEAFHADYAATKGAVIALTKSLAVQFGPKGVRSNAICPGPIETPLLMEWLLKEPKEKAKRLNRIPMGRFGKTEDIVNLALYLASDEASWTNGAALVADGGITANYF